MALFFNRNREVSKKENKYLEDQNAVFETKDTENKNMQTDSYDEYIIRAKDYSNIPKYKAFDEKRVDVVVDNDALDVQNLNPDVVTVNIEKRNLHGDLQEIMMGAPLDDENSLLNTSIYDEALSEKIKADDSIEIIDVDNDKTQTVISEVVEENVKKDGKLSIFGTTDEPLQAKVYGVKEVPVQPKIEIIVIDIKEEKIAENETIKFNEKGNKICPQCGAPLAPDAPVCFLCGNKF